MMPDKRRQIMQAAEAMFTTRRVHEITMDHVAEAAGVGKGTIYRYFADKDELFFETATSGFDDLCELLLSKVPQEGPFDGQLLAACVEISRFFQRRRQLLRMMDGEEGRMFLSHGAIREKWMDKRKRLIAAIAGLIAAGVAEGAVRKDISPDVLAAFLLGMLRTRARDLCGAPEPMRQYEVVVDLFFQGARAAGKGKAACVR